MANIKRNNLTKVTMNLPSNVVKEVRKYAEELGTTLTNAYIVLINLGLEQKELYRTSPSTSITEEDIKRLADAIVSAVEQYTKK